MWRCVDPGLTDVSEELIASIFRAVISESGEAASAGGFRLSQQSNTSYITQDLHSATSQKMTFFIVTAVKTSNRTYRSRYVYVLMLVTNFKLIQCKIMIQ
jgi:hypothetical protein